MVCAAPTGNGPIGSRHVCLTTDTPITMLLQLETGPNSRGDRCVCTQLEGVSWICEPTMVPIVDNSLKTMEARSASSADSHSLEDSTMVPTGSGDVDKFPATSAQDRRLLDLSIGVGVCHASGPGVPQLATWPL